MNWDQVQGKWKQMRGSIREKWGQLTDDDLNVIAGNRDKFVGVVQERYGIAKEEAVKRTDDWLKTLSDTSHQQGQQSGHQQQGQHGGHQPNKGDEKTYTGRP